MLTPDVIDKATENFRQALQLMSEDGHTIHAFNLGRTPDGTMFSIMIIVDTKQLGGAVFPRETS